MEPTTNSNSTIQEGQTQGCFEEKNKRKNSK